MEYKVKAESYVIREAVVAASNVDEAEVKFKKGDVLREFAPDYADIEVLSVEQIGD